MFVDTHCHLTDSRYDDVGAVIENFRAANVGLAVTVGYDLASSEKCAELVGKYGDVFFAAGMHPDAANEVDASCLAAIERLAAHKKCVAIGEIGLDYHYDGYDERVQKRVFAEQLELAISLKMPVSIHSRDCTADMLKVLTEYKARLCGAVMHCFSGSLETAKTLLGYGIYLSFAGPVTFKNAGKVAEVAAYVPLDMFLTETDSPYLAPHPYRGRTNEPGLVGLVTAKIAELKNKTTEEIAAAAERNARALFTKMKV